MLSGLTGGLPFSAALWRSAHCSARQSEPGAAPGAPRAARPSPANGSSLGSYGCASGAAIGGASSGSEASGAHGGSRAEGSAGVPPCCEPCGGAGTCTSTASCPGWPSTSAASAGEEVQVLGTPGERRGRLWAARRQPPPPFPLSGEGRWWQAVPLLRFRQGFSAWSSCWRWVRAHLWSRVAALSETASVF